MAPERLALHSIHNFKQLIGYLRDELGWPIESDDFEELTFDYAPEELGLDKSTAVKIKEIKQLRPLSNKQPWGIFFVNFEPKRLPVVALRRILSRLVIKKRQSANRAQQATWKLHDLLFISSYGESEHRDLTFAHFSDESGMGDLPMLRVLGWDDEDTQLHVSFVEQELKSKLRWRRDETDLHSWRASWSSAFNLKPREVIKTSQQLAIRLADLARNIRHRMNSLLRIESEKGPLRKLHSAFKEALIHDLSEDDFADMYAQTISYGLLTARVSRPAGLVADNLTDMVPITNPFLKELLEMFLTVGGRKDKIDFDELGVNDVVQLLRAADMEAVLRDFGDRNPQEDPVIHFYELFLKEYDPEKRMKRGVFYTPRPVVSFIVRSVDEILRDRFKLKDGLADTSSWGEMVQWHRGLEVPKGVSPDQPFVQILDAAVGTGTFLVEVIEVIHNTMQRKWKREGYMPLEFQRLWNQYVPKYLLPRLYGFELMMAPYAIAHMKIGLKLYETGYRFDSNERARIYLTNSLEVPKDEKEQREFAEWAPALAHEAAAVDAVKIHQHFTVLLGNPPYSFTSQNLDPALRAWVDPYRSIDGVPLKEKGALQAEKAIQDDYIKFMRFAEWHVSSAKAGVVGMISSHGYLDNPTLRGMRFSYLSSFESIVLLDLHGNSTRKECSPDGSEDKNVFDIKQGVAIILALRTGHFRDSASVRYSELWGSRESKYVRLLRDTNVVDPIEVFPEEPFFLFRPQNAAAREEYEQFLKITEIMPQYGVGCFTSKDHFVIGFKPKELIENAKAFRDSDEPDEVLCEKLGISMKQGWNVRKARELIRKDKTLEHYIRPILYRPFDERLIFYHPSLVWSMSMPTMKYMLNGNNLAFAIGRAGAAIDQREWNIVLCVNTITDLNLYRRGGNSIFPLYLNADTHAPQTAMIKDSQPRINFSRDFLNSLSNRLALKSQANGLPDGINPADIFSYAYAMFYSPGYRRRYSEFLKVDFPRLPLTGSIKLFQQLCQIGDQLTKLHLMESPLLDKPPHLYVGSKNPIVDKVSYRSDTVWLDKAQTEGFRSVPESVWNFHIGGYQICEKWLKDRKMLTLSKDDIEHYERMVLAIRKTIRIMTEIDEVIDAHGGWPEAFLGSKARRQEPDRKHVIYASEVTF